MTKIPTWKINEMKKEISKDLRVVADLEETLVSLPLPAWRVKEIKKQIKGRLANVSFRSELIQAGVFGA